MPFQSVKQKKFLYSKKPAVAKKFAEHSRTMPDMPVKKKKMRMTDSGKMKY